MKHIEESLYEGESFEQEGLAGVYLTDCFFRRCSFTLTSVEGTRFNGVEFVDCKLTGVDFSQCDKMIFSLAFDQSVLSACNFSGLDMRKAQITSCRLCECQFVDANLRHANFANTDLSGTSFHHCELGGADLRGASNYQIDPTTNQVRDAQFSLPEAVSLLNHLEIRLS